MPTGLRMGRIQMTLCVCGDHKEDHAGVDSYGLCVIVGCGCKGYEAK